MITKGECSMKNKSLKLITFFVMVMLCLTATCVNVFADSDVLYSAGNTVEMNGTDDAYVSVSISASSDISLLLIQGVWSTTEVGGNYLTLTNITTDTSKIFFDGTENDCNVNSGYLIWLDGNYEGVSFAKDEAVITATYLVSADTPVGTYTVEFDTEVYCDAEETEYYDDFTFTITVTEASCEHTNTTAVPNGNHTHAVVCNDCNETVEKNVDCTYTFPNPACEKCGAECAHANKIQTGVQPAVGQHHVYYRCLDCNMPTVEVETCSDEDDDGDHDCDYCGQADVTGHTGGTATCTSAKVCTECGDSYGTSNGHGTNDGFRAISNDNGTHTKYCNDCGAEIETVDCSGETVVFAGNCVSPIHYECSVCEGSFHKNEINSAVHAAGDIVSYKDKTGATHTVYHPCCGEPIETVPHDKKTENFAGNCVSPAVYTCTCGQTYETEINPAVHAAGENVIYKDATATTHTVYHPCCDEPIETVPHSFTNGVCEECNYTCTHSKVTTNYSYNGNAIHLIIEECDYCDLSGIGGEEACSGGTATCTKGKICEVCEGEYTVSAGHQYEYDCDKNCSVCGEETRPNATHTDVHPIDYVYVGNGIHNIYNFCFGCSTRLDLYAENEYCVDGWDAENECEGHDGICDGCEEAMLTGWVNRGEEGWFYIDPVTFKPVTGLVRVEYPSVEINGITYAPNAADKAYWEAHKDTSKYSDATTAVFYFDEEGKFVQYTGLVDNGTRFAVNGCVAWHVGMVKVGADYYYFGGDKVNGGGNILVTGKVYATRDFNSGLPMNSTTYDITDDGKVIVVDKDTTGIVKLGDAYYYYVDGKLAKGAGVVALSDENGTFYIYVKSNGELATGIYWPTTTNGLLDRGAYNWGDDGKYYQEIPAEKEIREVDGVYYYYENGIKQIGAGIVELTDAEGVTFYIYVKSNGKLATGLYWPTTRNDLLPRGEYDWGNDGKYYPAN